MRDSVTTGFGVAALAPAWEELAERVGAPPFLQPGWVVAWWRAFGRGALQPVAVHRGDELVAVLPLIRRRGGVDSPSNSHTPLFGAVFDGPEAAAALAGVLFASAPPRLRLGYVSDSDVAAQAVLARGAAAGYRTIARRIWHSPYLDIEGDLASYLAARKRGSLSDLHRRRRRMDEQGNVSVEIADGTSGLDRLLGEAFAIEAMGWKGKQGTAISSSAATRRFYADVSRFAADRGWLRLFVLRLDGRPVAFDLTLEHGGVEYMLKGGFDPNHARFAPGQQLLEESIRRAFATGLRRIEFGGAAEPYKLMWTDTAHGRDEIRAFAPSFAGRLWWVAEGRLLPLARRAGLTRVVGRASTRLRRRLAKSG
jgi:CelD/BcsL family acetyltransferase involved in cellulose biosynthesis